MRGGNQKPPPVLAPPNTPVVKSTTGLGTGGGAGVQTPDSDGFGHVRVCFGPNALAAGNVILQFPSPPSVTFFVSGDDVFGPITQSLAGVNLTIAWTAATPPKTASPQQYYRLNYEWF